MRIDYPSLRANWLPVLVALLFALFVITLPRYMDLAKTWYVLLLLAGLGCLLLDFRQLAATTSAERLFIAVVVLNFSWIAFSYYANGQTDRGASFLWGRHFYLLLLIPMFFLFRKVRVSDKAILLILVASVAFSLGDILIDIARGIDYRGARMKRTNINGFAPIQLCLSGILLLYFTGRSETVYKWMAMAGFAIGITTILLSKSRSTWVTLIVIGALYSLYLVRSPSPWKRALVVLLVLMVIAASYLLPIVKSRVDKTIASVEAYLASDDYLDESRSSPIGTRFELWKTGWYIFLENPLLGVGVGNFKEMAKANSERYRINNRVHHYLYVHNQYIAALATRGIPGLILLLLVLAIPIYITMTQKSSDRNDKVARLSIILVCLVYMIGNLAEDHLETKPAIMFISIVLPMLLARISPRESVHNDVED